MTEMGSEFSLMQGTFQTCSSSLSEADYSL